jgi:hypothetical protein
MTRLRAGRLRAAWLLGVGLGLVLAGRLGDGTAARLTARSTAPPDLHSGTLMAISCRSTRFCVAVGTAPERQSLGAAERPLTLLWDGSMWRYLATPIPAGATGVSLDAVSCPSRRACVAVGSTTIGTTAAVPVIEHWDGTVWRVQPTLWSRGALSGVSCATPRFCVAVGGRWVVVWHGDRWRASEMPGHSRLNGVSCAGPRACVAVGASGSRMLIERWDGSEWATQQPAPVRAPFFGGDATFSSALSGVSCVSATACAAAGSASSDCRCSVDGQQAVGIVEFWSGRRWTARELAVSQQLGQISCVAARECFAVDPWAGVLYREDRAGFGWARAPGVGVYGYGGTADGLSCSSSTFCEIVGATPGLTWLAVGWNAGRLSAQSAAPGAG